MLDLQEINKEIEKLESGKTSHDSCFKLSYLYTVRDHILSDEKSAKIPQTIQSAKELVSLNSPLTSTPTPTPKNYEMEIVEEYNPIEGDMAFCNLVQSKGNKRILKALAKYMEHLRAYQPAQYSRLMDKLSQS